MITDLRLQNFRSYLDASFEFDKGVNIIVGPNASGKTNLLEAILVLSKGSSYRVKDLDLISFNKPWARLDSHSEISGQRTIKITAEPKSKTYEIDNRVYKRLTLNNTLPVVLFEPTHLQLLAGGPERRREYIDDLLEETLAGYKEIRLKYKRALAQRNRLLKNNYQSTSKMMFPWNVRMSQLAGQIVRARHQAIESVNREIGDLYIDISKAKTKVSIEYDSRWPSDSYESRFLSKLETSLQEDRLRGFTSTGPHREDLVILFDGHPATEIASRGEVRTAVLALKIIELQIIESTRDSTPILLLDDVFSELDGARRHALTDYLSRYQTFITTTDADLVTRHFTDDANVIALS